MNRSAHFLVVGCLCALAACLGQNVAQAQQSFYSPYNNYYQAQAALLASNPLAAMQAWNRQAVVNNQALQLYSTRYYGRTVNPVTAPGLFPNYYNSASYYPNYNYPSYSYPTTYPYYQSSGVNPYTASVPVYNPYTATVPGYGANPYTPTGGGIANPYSPSNPYNNSYGSGSVLNGAADGLRAEGQYINSLETARILREQANQYKLETTKKEFELRAYIKANTASGNTLPA